MNKFGLIDRVFETKDYMAAQDFYITVLTARTDFLLGNITTQDFYAKCEGAVLRAQESPLKEHGILRTWLNAILKALKIVVAPTESIQKVNAVEGAVLQTKSIKDEINRLKEEKHPLEADDKQRPPSSATS